MTNLKSLHPEDAEGLRVHDRRKAWFGYVEEIHDELNPDAMAEALDRAATLVAQWLVGNLEAEQVMNRLHDDVLAPWSSPRDQWALASDDTNEKDAS